MRNVSSPPLLHIRSLNGAAACAEVVWPAPLQHATLGHMSKFCSAVLAVAALATPALAHAQVDRTRTWDVYGGFVANRESNSGNPIYNYGWDGSLAQRNDSRHWLGGMIQGSAVYTKAAGDPTLTTYVPAQKIYTATVGPVFTTRVGGIAPTGHALFGAAITSTSYPAVGLTPAVTNSANHFGSAIGGGFDFPISRGHHAALRTQADWLRVWQSTSPNLDMLQMSAGLLYSFY